MAISVLVADDEAIIRAGLVALLGSESDIEVVAEADSGAAAVDRARELQPDVVLMDLAMPGTNGIEATRKLAADPVRDADHLTTVLVLTTFRDDDKVRAALRAGASGYLLKHSTPRDLATAIRQVAKGHLWIDAAVVEAVLTALRGPVGAAGAATELLARLTPREREVLARIARGRSNEEISRELHVSNATVRTHISRIVMKTGSRNRAEAVIVAYESGLVTPGGADPHR